MASFLQDAINLVGAALTAAGVTWTADPAAVRPKSVFVELPTFTQPAKAVADVTVLIRVLGAPPGNTQTNKWILDTVETIMASPIAIVRGGPSSAEYGGSQLPTYDLDVRVGTNR